MTHKSCKMCGGSAATPFAEKGGFRILKCDSCAVVYLDRDPDEETLRDFYSGEYFESPADGRGYASYTECEGFLTGNFRRRVERLRRHVPGGNVLDVGCGYGYFLNCLGSEYKGVGLDLAEYAVRIASERYGVDARAGALGDSSFPPGHFSLVTMWDVLEHLPDPERTLRIARTILRDDGVLALTTGDVGSLAAKLSRGKWHLYTLPEHLWFFSQRTLGDLLAKSGFRVIEVRREWCCYSIAYLIERLWKTFFDFSGRMPPLPAAAWLNRWAVPFNLFDVMFVVARKK